MKDYKRLILWIDYFNSTLSREDGRRIPLDKSVKDPTIDELSEAARRLGYEPEPFPAKHPIRMTVPSGFVSIEKRNNAKKSLVIGEVAKTLSMIRGEKTAAAAVKDQTRPQQRRH